jgi:tetratricopeptide (TPR) repeat protein
VTKAVDLLIGGQFAEAIIAYEQELSIDPANGPASAGLASALMGAGQYEAAIPLKWAAHERALREVPDSCGLLVDLACAYWCIDDLARAISLAHDLVEGNLAGRINMAPDLAGGASFGLMLYYMAVTVEDQDERDYALAFLRKLKAKYDKNPRHFNFPKVTVQQLFGSASFEDALESARGARSMPEALAKAKTSRRATSDLSVVLFNDGVFRRAEGDDDGCRRRIREVYDLGYWAEPIHWYFARKEVTAG